MVSPQWPREAAAPVVLPNYVASRTKNSATMRSLLRADAPATSLPSKALAAMPVTSVLGS